MVPAQVPPGVAQFSYFVRDGCDVCATLAPVFEGLCRDLKACATHSRPSLAPLGKCRQA